jgi:chromosome segregation ATPase
VKNIQTGVDKLVELISAEKRVSLDDASKKLGISAQVIQEWGEFLEKEGLVTIEYSLSKIWLCEKKLSKREISDVAKEISSEKDAFLRKIDSALKTLQKETAGFEEIKSQFAKIQSDVKDKIDIVGKELSELEKYTAFKQNIDKTIEKQKLDYDKSLAEIVKTIQKTKTEYSTLNEGISKELKEIDSAHEKVLALQRTQANLVITVNSAKDSIAHLEKEIAQEQESISTRLKKIDELKLKADNFQKMLINDKESPVDKLINKISDDRKKIMQEQEDLLAKAKNKTKELQDYSDLISQIRGSFKGFFAKKIKTEQMILKIEEEKVGLDKSLKSLEEKAKGLDLMNSSKELKSQIAEISQALKDYEQNRSGLMKKVNDLIDFIKS